MFKIAICDDEPVIAEQIKMLIQSIEDIPGQIDIFYSGEQLLSSGKSYDLIFLDIGMKTMTGIETGRKIREFDKKVRIIYVTAYKDYAAQAFDVHAFGYILKPIKQEQLLKVYHEAYTWYTEEEQPRKLEFETTAGLVVMDVRQIYYFEYENRKVKMVTARGDFFIHSRITDIYQRMLDDGFEMPHKSFVINMFHVRRIMGTDIIMTNGDRVLLSQKKASYFRKALYVYIENHH